MTIGSCFGDANKNRILALYDIAPLLRQTLPPGRPVKGCCGDIHTDCYIFVCTPKGAQGPKEFFFVGDHCANEFLQKASLHDLPPFSVFSQTGGGKRPAGGGGGGGGTVSPMSPLNTELYNAIQFLLFYLQELPRAPLMHVLEYLYGSPLKDASVSKVKIVNTVVFKMGKGLTLRGMINNFSHQNRNVKNLKFDLIRNILSAAQIANYIDP